MTALRELAERWKARASLSDGEDDLAFANNTCAAELLAILDAEGDGGAVIGWVFQHDETGRMAFCENDGVNNPENFAANNPRHVLCGPAYTHPARSGVVSDEDVRDAARWRTFIRVLRTRIPGPGHGTRIKVVEVCPVFGEEKEIDDITAAIDAARKGERHE